MTIDIIIDEDAGEAAILIDEWFLNESALYRADILKDIISALQVRYDEAVVDLNTELKAIRDAAQK